MTENLEHNENIEGRRPLKVRNANLAKNFAVWLSNKNITPNQISVISVFFAGLASICFFLIPSSISISNQEFSFSKTHWILPLLAGLFIQCRLLCNLFDGMVAMEGGKSTPAGELFNDIPDRIADPLLLIAAGYAISTVSWGCLIGWAAGLLAVMTAYIRTLSVSIGAPVDFSGPMAKQHRMAILTIACILSSFEGSFWTPGYSLLTALIIIIIGCIMTICRRTLNAYNFLEK